jgi:hypothetical protein
MFELATKLLANLTNHGRKAISSQSTLLQCHRRAPQVEALESRQLLSANVVLSGGRLSITGTDQPDQIQINDDGTRVLVFANGALKGTFFNVNNIVVNTKGGNDTVTYDILGTDPINIGRPGPNPGNPTLPLNVAVTRKLTADLGSGNDLFQANVVESLTGPGLPTTPSSLGANSNLDIEVKGGTGNDSALFRAGIIGTGSNVRFDFNGGQGGDAFNVIYGLPVAAQQANTNVLLDFQGGKGNDAAFVDVIGDLPAANSQTHINLLGGRGDDSLFAHYDNGIMNGFFQLLADGGPGKDRIIADFEMRPGSNLGEIDALVEGGTGNDDLTLIAHKQAPGGATVVNGRIDGGPGTDTAHFTSGVAVSASEILVPVA